MLCLDARKIINPRGINLYSAIKTFSHRFHAGVVLIKLIVRKCKYIFAYPDLNLLKTKNNNNNNNNKTPRYSVVKPANGHM